MAKKKKAKLNIVEMRIDQLVPADYNPRKISSDAMLGLKHSIKKHGYVENIIFNKRTGHLVSGHQRVKALADEGYEYVDVNVVDLPLEEEKILNIQMNNHMIEGQFTGDLESILEEIKMYDPETYDTTMMYELEKNIIDEYEGHESEPEDEESEIEKPEMDVERMPLQPFESYDAIVVICEDTQDFKYLIEKFDLKRVNMSPLGEGKKIGQNRVVKATKVISLLSKGVVNDHE